MSFTRLIPIIALAATLGAPLAAQAQTLASPAPAASMAPSMSHHHRHHRQSLMRQLGALNLTDAQKQQVATYHAQEQQANQNADAGTKRANAMKMRTQIMGILTPDQKMQLRSHMGHGKSMRGSGSPAPDAMASPQGN